MLICKLLNIIYSGYVNYEIELYVIIWYNKFRLNFMLRGRDEKKL